MTSAYIRELNKLLPTQSSRSQPQSLKQRFLDWYLGMPEFTRNRSFSMSEFETALKTQGKYISRELLALGWHRKRLWNTTGHYHRYWQPPQRSD